MRPRIVSQSGELRKSQKGNEKAEWTLDFKYSDFSWKKYFVKLKYYYEKHWEIDMQK